MKLFSNPPSTHFASIVAFLSASIWGLYWVPLRYLGGEGIDGGWAVAMLNFPAAVILFLVAAWQWQQHRGFVGKSLIIGFFTGLGIALYTAGLVHSSVVRATLLFYTTPVWATLIGIFWLGEQANWQRWAAIAVGLIGLGMMVSGGSDSVPLNIGDGFALLAGIVWALGASMIKRFEGVPLAGMNMFQFFFTASLAILLGMLVSDSLPDPDFFIRAIPFSTLISLLVVLPSVWLIFWAQKYLFPGRAGLLMMSEVLVAVVSASIFLPEEYMSLIEWLGAGLIITACLIEVLG
ncbi:MAG: DMT family transporter, partial [Thiolinea sp.]